jgi:hypothetical protein
MSDKQLEQAVEAVRIEVAKLDLAPGNAIAVICPHEWSIPSVVRFGEFFEAYIKRQGITNKFMVFPPGVELAIISPEKSAIGPIQKLEDDGATKSPHDDGRKWGFMVEPTIWIEIPKVPMLLANLGPPPFDVELPSGEVRHIIHDPAEASPDGRPQEA